MKNGRIDHIIETIYTERRFNEFLTKLEPADLRADLRQFVVTELYRIADKYPGKLEGLHLRGQLFAFIHGMARNTLMSESGTFYRHYRNLELRKIEPLEGLHLDHTPAPTDDPADHYDYTPIIDALPPDDIALLRKAKELGVKRTKQERQQVPKLTKQEKQRLDFLRSLLRYRHGQTIGNLPDKYARFALTVTVTIPKGATTDAVLDAADWLHSVGVGLLQHQTGINAVVDIAPPRLLGTNLTTCP